MASQIDIPPTILDLLGAKGDGHFFGQTLFEEREKPTNPVLLLAIIKH